MWSFSVILGIGDISGKTEQKLSYDFILHLVGISVAKAPKTLQQRMKVSWR